MCMSDKIRRELEKIEIPEELHNRAQLGVEKAKQEMNSRSDSSKKRTKNLGYFLASAAVLFGLFVGSAFVHPVMAEMASKLPYLGQFFEQDSITEVIWTEIGEDYKIEGVGTSYFPESVVHVTLGGNDGYYAEVKADVKSVVEEILVKRGFDAYSVEVDRPREPGPEMVLSEEEKRRNEETMWVMNDINDAFKARNIESPLSSIRDNEKIMAEVPKATSDEKIKEIKAIINGVLDEKGYDGYTIHVKKIDMVKMDQDMRWAGIISLLAEEVMGKEDFKVTSLGYTVHPQPEVLITTSVKSSDSEAEEFAEELSHVINKYLESEEMKSKVKDDDYIITIRSKDKKKLN